MIQTEVNRIGTISLNIDPIWTNNHAQAAKDIWVMRNKKQKWLARWAMLFKALKGILTCGTHSIGCLVEGHSITSRFLRGTSIIFLCYGISKSTRPATNILRPTSWYLRNLRRLTQFTLNTQICANYAIYAKCANHAIYANYAIFTKHAIYANYAILRYAICEKIQFSVICVFCVICVTLFAQEYNLA